MEGELDKYFTEILSEGDATAIECFDPEGLPILSRGNNEKSASNVLSSIFKHARIITEDDDLVVVIEREKSSIFLAQYDGYMTALHKGNS
ncbi:hypothetical protein SprV_0100363100 [Sparganum proliferum]